MAEQATNRTERAMKGTLASFLQYGTQMLLQVFLAPLVLRLAGQETLGAYALLMQVVGYLAMLDLGFSVTLNRYLAQAIGHDDSGKRFDEVMSTARTFLLGSNLAIALLTLLVGFTADTMFSLAPHTASQARLGLAVLAVWTLARTPWVVYATGLNATQNLASANLIGVIGNASRLLLSLALVYTGAGLVGLMLANVLSEAVSIWLCSSQFRRLFPGYRPAWGIPDKKLFREMLSFSLQAMLINVAWRLVYYTDNIVIGYLYGASAVSIYYITQMPTTIGFNIANRVSDNAAPAVNELYAREDVLRLRDVFLRLHRISFMVVLPLACGILLLNRQLITLWVGSAQYAGDAMTAALAVFAFLITLTHVNGTFLFASGNIRAFGRIAVLEGVCNLALSLLLGRYFGLAGVMWSTVIANFPATSYLLMVTLRRLKIGLGEYLGKCLAPCALPVLAGCLACLVSARWAPGRGWGEFIVKGSALTGVYAGLSYWIGLTRSEREWLESRFFQPLWLTLAGRRD